MSNEHPKSPQFMLGEMYSDIKWLRAKAEAQEQVDNDFEVRVAALERFKFKLVFIVASVGALFGFLFSNLKEGVTWLKEALT